MATINGNNSDNTLVGTAAGDTIRARGGDDVIFAGAGNDTALGGDGNDTINGGAGDDLLDGGNGNDTLFDDSGTNRFIGGAGNDLIEVRGDVHPDRYVEITTGAGRDEIQIWGYDAHLAELAVTDFDKGAYNAADVLNLRDIYTVDTGNGRLSAVVTRANIAQFVSVEADGQGGTAVYVDSDGTGGEHDLFWLRRSRTPRSST